MNLCKVNIFNICNLFNICKYEFDSSKCNSDQK